MNNPASAFLYSKEQVIGAVVNHIKSQKNPAYKVRSNEVAVELRTTNGNGPATGINTSTWYDYRVGVFDDGLYRTRIWLSSDNRLVDDILKGEWYSTEPISADEVMAAVEEWSRTTKAMVYLNNQLTLIRLLPSGEWACQEIKPDNTVSRITYFLTQAELDDLTALEK